MQNHFHYAIWYYYYLNNDLHLKICYVVASLIEDPAHWVINVHCCHEGTT